MTGVRFDGIDTLYVDVSESVSGALNAASFILSGATAAVSGVNFPSLSDSGTITLTNSGIVAGTSELSFSLNSVGDVLGNKQSTKLFAKISATVILSEVMWSGTGAGTSQYIELRNLGGASIDISGWKIDNATANGTATLTIPAGQTIAANGYYLITSAPVDQVGNLLSDVLPVNLSGSLGLASGQVGNLVLKSSGSVVYDQAKTNPWPAGDSNLPASMERKPSVGDGLSPASWYTAQTGIGFDSMGPLGTPGTANVFDATAPSIDSYAPANNTLYPAGNIAMTYTYSDSGGISAVPAYLFLLEKNDGAGGYSDVTGSSLASSGTNASVATFTTSTLAYGQYRATFRIYDAAGNSSEQVSHFYVDAPSLTISSGSYNIGTLSASGTVLGAGTMTVTFRSLGAGFRLSLGGSGTLSAGVSEIGAWNGTTGYGMDYAATGSGTSKAYDGILTALSGSVLENFATGSHVGGNGNLRTFIYTVKYGAKIDALQAAGIYVSDIPVNIELQY